MPRFWSDILLVLHVLLNDFERCSANGRNKIRIRPQAGQPRSQGLKFFSEVVRRDAFDIFYEAMNPKLWVHFAEHVNVVWHDFQCDDIGSILQSSLTHDFLKPFGDVADKNFAAILRAPNDVVFAAVNHIVVRLVSKHHEESVRPLSRFVNRYL